MSSRAPHILLAGESLCDALPLVESLQKWGFELHIATSYQEARKVLEQFGCELVLSKMRLRDASAYPLISLLAGSRTTLYFFLPVHRSCWWLPAIRQGQNCWGAPAIRPGEFARVLDKILQGMKQQSTPPLAAEVHQESDAADTAVPLTVGGAAKPPVLKASAAVVSHEKKR